MEKPAINAALDGLWIRFLPQMQERLRLLQTVVEAIEAGDLPGEERSAAEAAAHKLAGVLGTFGLSEGTALAREAEALWAGDVHPAARLRQITEELAAMIAGRGVADTKE